MLFRNFVTALVTFLNATLSDTEALLTQELWWRRRWRWRQRWYTDDDVDGGDDNDDDNNDAEDKNGYADDNDDNYDDNNTQNSDFKWVSYNSKAYHCCSFSKHNVK